jgi:NTE family protein
MSIQGNGKAGVDPVGSPVSGKTSRKTRASAKPAKEPRRGLVLGAGGVLGAAWSIGALNAIAEVEGFDPHCVEIIVGTSAGSVLAALLGAGLTVSDLRDHQRGLPLPHEVGLDWDYDRSTGGATPTRPRLGLGSPALLRRTIIRPRQVPPLAVLAALAPAGTGTLAEVGRMVGAVAGEGGWVQRDGVWVVAMDYDSGRRTTFGRVGSPKAMLDEAVMASCAIPGWYAPVQIGGRRYVDGGTWSTTNLDVVAREGLDEVYVLAPMAAFVNDHPHRLATRVERRVRRQVTRRLLHEAEKVTRVGAGITILAPGPEDLSVIGVNMMDPTRRLDVLETSMRTSAIALRDPQPDDVGLAL